MVNWYIQKTLFLLVICLIWTKQAPGSIADSFSSKAKECHNINTLYQEVYSFETENYYINICQLDSKFYYYRQSKLNHNTNILIPARAVSRGDVFQATVGKTTYFVGMDSDRHYSSVMLNNNEIVFEPELRTAEGNTRESLAEVKSTSSQTIGYQQGRASNNDLDNASLELDNPEGNRDQVLICAREKSAFHPHLEGWQRLIGRSLASANKYAVSNGHALSYDEQNPNLASITTQDGEVIDLGIATEEKVVEQVCIQPTDEE